MACVWEGWEMMCVSLCVVGVSSLCMLGVREESLCDIEGVWQREKGCRRMVVVSNESTGNECTECRSYRRQRKEVERMMCGVN